MIRAATASLTVLLAAVAMLAVTGCGGTDYRLIQVAEVEQPTVLTWAPGQPQVMYVAERTGKIRVIRKGKLLDRPFLDVSRRVKAKWMEQGLLGLVFAPDYERSRRFYVYFTGGDGNNRLEEYRSLRQRPLLADPDSRRPILQIPQVKEGGGHNGGALRFRGDQLYVTVGDGNNPGDKLNNAQSLDSLRGKILRIVPRPDRDTGRPYRIPADNPLVGQPGRDEIFAWGLRNPHAMSIHTPGDGEPQLLVSDVGQFEFEELNYLPLAAARGANFGWKMYEGNEVYNCGERNCPNGGPVPPGSPDPDDLAWPALTYTHFDGDQNGCSIIGGPVIEDPDLPSLRGRAIYGDFCAADGLYTVRAGDSKLEDNRWLGIFMPPGEDKHPALNGIGTDALGGVYLFSNFGPVYRLLED